MLSTKEHLRLTHALRSGKITRAEYEYFLAQHSSKASVSEQRGKHVRAKGVFVLFFLLGIASVFLSSGEPTGFGIFEDNQTQQERIAELVEQNAILEEQLEALRKELALKTELGETSST